MSDQQTPDTVQRTDPAVDSPAAVTERGVLFADVSGSTSMYETLGDAQALRLINRSFTVLQGTVLAHGGRLVKTVGDELFCCFDSASDAMAAASDMQLALDQLRESDGTQVSIRIGVHFGPVIEERGDVFGVTVNIAARMVGLANPGQIFATWQTVNALSSYLRSSCRRLYSINVKGKADRVVVYEMIWKDAGDLTAPNGPATMEPSAAMRLRLMYKGAVWTVDRDSSTISMGRGRESNVVVQAWKASRNHATVSLRQGKFVLTDHSSNGTFLLLEDDVDLLLRREDLVLIGRGLVGLGIDPRDASQECISFSVA